MREKMLLGLARAHSHHPWRMLALTALLTILFGAAASQLQVTMRWSDLLPSDDPRTIQFNNIVEEFKTSTSLIVVVQGEPERTTQFADEYAAKLIASVDEEKNAKLRKEIADLEKKLAKAKDGDRAELQNEMEQLVLQLDEKFYQRIDYKAETEFLRDHALMLVKEKDLKNIGDIYWDANLPALLTNVNNSMEKEYVGQQESISTREKEDGAVMFLEGLESLVDLLTQYSTDEDTPQSTADKAVDQMLFGDSYFLSYDKSVLVMMAIPNFDMTDIAKVVSGTRAAQKIIDDMAKSYPDVKAGLTGFIAIGHDEMVYSEQSLGYTSIIALVAILLLLILSFRMIVAPFLALFSLLIGTIWAIGAAALVVGQLNIMTQMMTVILFGLGIDFSIHIISGFTERRALGDEINAAIEMTLLKSGTGVLTGAVTTACAFLTLVISHSRGMKELGLVTGFGLLAILLATLLMLPSLLVLRDRRLERRRIDGKKAPAQQRDISFRFLGTFAQLLSKKYVISITVAVLITLYMLFMSSKMTFDYNYLNVEPEGLTSISLQDTVTNKFDMGMDYAMVIASSPQESRSQAQQYRKLASVARTEDISLYLPSKEQQQRRVPYLKEIRNRMENAPIKAAASRTDIESVRRELDRLQMNIIEMQDMAFTGGQDKVDNKCKNIVGDPEDENPQNKIKELLQRCDDRTISTIISKYQRAFAPRFKASVLRMCNTTPLELKDLPESILDRYSNTERDQFLVTIFPAANIWTNAQFLDQFTNDLESVSDQVTGMPPVFRALIEVIGSDGKKSMMATLVIVFLLLWLDFRKPGYALLAMLPLGAGVIWMVGLMHLTGQQFTVMNVMGLPMILGIGIDDGVHVLHRWIKEGKKNLFTVFSSTGKAILLTSLTTMLAFGSLIFSIWRGFGQLGAALFVGVAACFLTTVLFLPGLLYFFKGKSKL